MCHHLQNINLDINIDTVINIPKPIKHRIHFLKQIKKKRPFDNKQTIDIDASIVTDHMMLEATELGLGTVWVCYFKPDIIKKEFELPDTLEPVNILLIGYFDEEPMPLNRHRKTRIPLSQLVSYEMLGN